MKLLKKMLSCLGCMVFLYALFAGVTVRGAAGTDYILEDGDKRPMPQAYTYAHTISVAAITGKNMSSPQDLFVAPSGELYIADTENNRVVVLNPDGSLKKEITEAGEKKLAKPQGIFVDNEGHLFIADSANARIVHMSASYQYIEEFGKPETNYFSSISLYSPAKIIFSESTGFLYTIMGKELITLDAKNDFKGYFGANKMKFSFKNLFIRLFASEEQKRRIRKSEPVSISNIHLENNLIYAVCAGGKDNIKIINGIGNNIFPAGSYGEYEISKETGLPAEPILVDIAVNHQQVITVAQENNSRLYQYDKEGNLLAVFGGQGKTAGYFSLISSIAMDTEGRLYILDRGQQNIQVLEPTHFTTLLHEAGSLFDAGEYDKAYTALEEISRLAPTYKPAREKMGDIYYRKGDYQKAMHEFRLADVQDKYAKAFEKERYRFMQSHFLLTALGAGLIIAAAIILMTRAAKMAKAAEHAVYFDNPVPWKMSLLFFPMAIFHPVRMFERIKHNRFRLSALPAFILLAAACLARVFQVCVANYTVADTTAESGSLSLEIAAITVPTLAFVLLCYLVTSLMSGECTGKELLLSCTYCFAPAIVGLPIMTALSWTMGASEAVFYRMGVLLIWAWVLVLIFVAVQNSNQYSFRKTLAVILISLIAIALAAALVMLIISLSSHMSISLQQIYKEASTLN